MDNNEQRQKIKIKPSSGSKRPDYRWMLITILITFSLSMIFTVVSTEVMDKVNLFAAVVVLVCIILLGIIFDIIGVAVTTADESPFNSMAIKKVRGSAQAIRLIKERSGIISGSASAAVVAHILSMGVSLDNVIVSLFITGLVAALTVGGKAIGKNIAIKYSNRIVYRVAAMLYIFGIWRKPKKR